MIGQADRFLSNLSSDLDALPSTLSKRKTINDQTSLPQQGSKDHPIKPLASGLYLVATPIGNLGDISSRALAILRDASIIACEDSRVTAKLLRCFGLHRPLLSYHEHNAHQAGPKILEALAQGQSVAMVSDAGCPVICDPGEKLLQQAREKGFPVTVIPGASAVMTGLQLSGLPANPFLFLGFLPSRATARRQELRRFSNVEATLVAFETPHRLVDSLADCAAVLGHRPAAVVREMTKFYEEVRNGDLAELAEHYQESGAPKGEIVLVIGPPQTESPPNQDDMITLIQAELDKGTRVKDAANLIAARTGYPRREVYAQALELSLAKTSAS